MRYPNIEAERARFGFNQSELAEKLGVTTKTYQNWQAAKSEIPGSKIIAMAHLFDVSSDYLLGVNNSKSHGKGCIFYERSKNL